MNSRNSGTCLGKPAFAYGPSSSAVADFGSGWAAVNGWRGNTDLAERIRFDLDYIERWSILFDAYIMLLTFSRNKNAY